MDPLYVHSVSPLMYGALTPCCRVSCDTGFRMGMHSLMNATGPGSWEEIYPIPVKRPSQDSGLPPIGRGRFRRRQSELRAQRWREARWVHRILRKQGRFTQLGIDKFVIKHEVRRSHFISQFANYLAVDPFVSNPHLIALFASFDLDCDGVADPREMTCAFRCAASSWWRRCCVLTRVCSCQCAGQV